jgi:hypothetical protein
MAACGASVSNASVSPSHQRALMTRVASCRAGGEHSQRPHRSAAQTVSRRERSRRQQRRGAAVGAQDHAAIVECKMIDRRQTADRHESNESQQRGLHAETGKQSSSSSSYQLHPPRRQEFSRIGFPGRIFIISTWKYEAARCGGTGGRGGLRLRRAGRGQLGSEWDVDECESHRRTPPAAQL